MDDDLRKRLEAHGHESVPDVDPAFVQRLESKLRIEHVKQGATSRRQARVLLPRLVAAVAIVAVGLAGFVALDRNDPGVPVAVIDDGSGELFDVAAPGGDQRGNDGESAEQVSDADAEAADGDSTTSSDAAGSAQDAPGLLDPTPTPTPSPSEPAATATSTPTEPALPVPVEPSPSATVWPDATVVPTSTPTPTSTLIPTATVPPTATVAPTPTPTPAEAAASPTSAPAAPRPTTTPTTLAEPLATATPTPTPTPTVEREPVPIELGCSARIAGDAVGVVCEWTAAPVDLPVASYELVRARNGDSGSIVSRQRASAPTSYVDRDVRVGDQVVYLVQGLTADGAIVAASVREVVDIPASE